MNQQARAIEGGQKDEAQLLEEIAGLRQRLAQLEAECQLINASLYEEQERFRSAFNNAPIGMALVAPDGRYLRVNRALCEMLGRSEQELLASSFASITHPDDLDHDLDQLLRMLDGEMLTYTREKRYMHADGHPVWIILSTSLVHDRAGQPLYFFSQMQDVTEHKRAAQEREQLISQLQEALSSNKTLNGLLPICHSCKKIRDDWGYWNQLEAYIEQHSEATFAHGLCPECGTRAQEPAAVVEEPGWADFIPASIKHNPDLIGSALCAWLQLHQGSLQQLADYLRCRVQDLERLASIPRPQDGKYYDDDIEIIAASFGINPEALKQLLLSTAG